MNKLQTFMMAVEKTNVFVGRMMAYVSLVCVAVISFEVIMRYAFGMPTNWGHELMFTLFAMYYVMVGGTAHFYRAHVRVDIFYASENPSDTGVHESQHGAVFLPFCAGLHIHILEFLLEFPDDERRQHFLGN